MAALAYRRDVDGLRAIAVGSVVLYHAGIPYLGGGYAGVDVFFVISGFIISRLLVREMQAGTFSLLGFYERRIRRILPALFLMLLATLAVGAVVMTPFSYKELGQSATAVVFFASNMFFWVKTGYFEPASELRPLLHTWSLGVEEQFYLIWPLLMPLLLKLSSSWRRIIVGVMFVASLALSQFLVQNDPNSAFYLIVSRAWELLAGAALAFGFFPEPTRRIGNVAAVAGLVLLVVTFVGYSSQVPFPGIAALLPVGASFLLIWAGSVETPISRVLGSPIMVWIGALSYSIYIWHWPIFSLSWYVLARPFTLLEGFLAVVATIGISLVSYRFVESPIRHAPRAQTQGIVIAAAACSAAVVVFGLGAHLSAGYPARWSPDALQLAAAGLDTNPRREQCAQSDEASIEAGTVCILGDAAVTAPSFALFGDSFADAMMPGFDDVAGKAGKRGVSLVRSGCLPLPAVDQILASCRPSADAALKYLVANPGIETVFLVGRWTAAVSGTRFGEFNHTGYWLHDAESVGTGADQNAAVLSRALSRLASMLPGRTIVLVAGVPEQVVDVPRYLAVQATLSRTGMPGVERALYDARRTAVDAVIADVLDSNANVRVLDLGPELCNAQDCPMLSGNVILYADDNHLTRQAALLLSPLFAAYI